MCAVSAYDLDLRDGYIFRIMRCSSGHLGGRVFRSLDYGCTLFVPCLLCVLFLHSVRRRSVKQMQSYPVLSKAGFRTREGATAAENMEASDLGGFPLRNTVSVSGAIRRSRMISTHFTLDNNA